MVALDFTDEIVYKNTHPVYVFIGALTPERPPSDVGCLGTAPDVSGYLDAIFWQDFSVFPAISLMQWTSLNVLERYWMVSRVATTFTS
jgi:hypothetical protein